MSSGDPLGRKSPDPASVVDRGDAGAVEGILRTDPATRFRHGDLGKRQLDQAAVGAKRTCGGTMGMAAIAYRFWFAAHGLKSLTQNLALVGIAPTRSTLIRMIEGIDEAKRR